jgi:hypothetical protein
MWEDAPACTSKLFTHSESQEWTGSRMLTFLQAFNHTMTWKSIINLYSYSHIVLHVSVPLTNTNIKWRVISGFRSEVAENCALLGYYTASSGSTIPCVITQKSTVLIKDMQHQQYTTVRAGCYSPLNQVGISVFVHDLRKCIPWTKNYEINASVLHKTDYAASQKNAVYFLVA